MVFAGLDPAGPFFESFDVKVRLDKTDAKFVDVIHSNGDDILSVAFGVRLPCGHVIKSSNKMFRSLLKFC